MTDEDIARVYVKTHDVIFILAGCMLCHNFLCRLKLERADASIEAFEVIKFNGMTFNDM